MFNRVILQGNTGRSPKLCFTQEGREILTFSLATVQSWKDKEGTWQSATDWHHIAVFRESTIKWLKKYLKRGDPVYIEGKLTYQSWTDKYGQQRYTPHVIIAGRDGQVVHLSSVLARAQASNLNPNSDSDPTLQDKPQSLPLEEESRSQEEEKNEDIPLEEDFSFEDEDIPFPDAKKRTLH